MLTFTDEQKAVISHFTAPPIGENGKPRSLIVEALAGSAKTTTIVAAINQMPEVPGQVLVVAFNKRIQKELEQKLPSWCATSTMNALGHKAWAGYLGKRINVNALKVGELTTELLKQFNVADPDGTAWGAVRHLASLAKTFGIVPTGAKGTPTGVLPNTLENWFELMDDFEIETSVLERNEIVDYAHEVLRRSIDLALQGEIDFDDQIYMPVVYGVAFPRYHTVVVDEAQDLNKLNHIMLRRSSTHRVIAIGDRHQSIYAFRGADTSGMDNLRDMFGADVLKLSTCFRCSKAVIHEAQKEVPAIKAFTQAPQGQVIYAPQGDYGLEKIPEHCAVLGRTNAPLIALAFALLRQNRAVFLLGSDLEKSLLTFISKVTKVNSMPLEEFETKLAAMVEKEKEKHRKENKAHLISRVEDRNACVRAIIEGAPTPCKTVADIKAQLKFIFSQTDGTITLSTGHKSKGFEWDTVVILDPWKMPGRFAREAAEKGNPVPLQQEKNLKYVMVTRAKKTLMYLDSNKLLGRNNNMSDGEF